MIRNATIEDAEAIRRIYNKYVTETCISFEEDPVSVEEMAARISEYSKAYPWLVFEEGGKVLGYCYATKWRVRPAYRHSAETTVYVDAEARSRGIGKMLCEELIRRLGEKGVHAAVAGIALPNEASQGLHERLGFEKVAHFSEIGRKHGKWIDVGYWELVLGEA